MLLAEYAAREPLLFIVDTRGLTLAQRGMTSPTTMGLDLTRAQLLEALRRGAALASPTGFGVVVVDP